METFFFAPVKCYKEPWALFQLRSSLVVALPDKTAFRWTATTDNEFKQYGRDWEWTDRELECMNEHTTLRFPGQTELDKPFCPFNGRLLQLADQLFKWAHPGRFDHGRLGAEFLIAVNEHRLPATTRLEGRPNEVSLSFSIELPQHQKMEINPADAFPGLSSCDAEFAYLREPVTGDDLRRRGVWRVLRNKLRTIAVYVIAGRR